MADERELLEQRIHDAYESVEPSAEAQERMLANLLAAQGRARQTGEGQTQAVATAEDTDASATRQREKTSSRRVSAGGQTGRRHAAKVTVAPGRRSPWRVVLPLAAMLVLVAVVVRVTGVSRNESRADGIMAQSSEKSSEPVSEDTAVADEPAAETNAMGVEPSITESADLDAGGEEFAAVERTVDVCPSITLEDGTRLTALRDGISIDEVDSERVGELLGRGSAAAFDAPDGEAGVPCEVFRLVDETDAYAVRYEGEETFWRCTPLV
jgi:hypothetical protein